MQNHKKEATWELFPEWLLSFISITFRNYRSLFMILFCRDSII